MRNAVFYYNINKYIKGDSLIVMRKHSINYLKKSLSYSNQYQKPNVLRVMGNLYNDMIANNQNHYKTPLIGLDKVFDTGVIVFQKAIKLGKETYKNPNRFLSQCYSLLALDYQYMKKYRVSDSLYDISIKYSKNNNEIIEDFIKQKYRGFPILKLFNSFA